MNDLVVEWSELGQAGQLGQAGHCRGWLLVGRAPLSLPLLVTRKPLNGKGIASTYANHTARSAVAATMGGAVGGSAGGSAGGLAGGSRSGNHVKVTDVG